MIKDCSLNQNLGIESVGVEVRQVVVINRGICAKSFGIFPIVRKALEFCCIVSLRPGS